MTYEPLLERMPSSKLPSFSDREGLFVFDDEDRLRGGVGFGLRHSGTEGWAHDQGIRARGRVHQGT